MEYLTFGPWLQFCRSAFLADIANSRHALVLGDGDGRFTARLLAASPAIRIDAVDASPAMLRSQVRRARRPVGRLRTHCADARHWQPSTPSGTVPSDLIATHFFLDCLTTQEVRALAARLHASAAPSALWVISEFAVPDSRFGRLVARPIVSALYRAFGLLTGLKLRNLPDHPAALRESGFTLQKRRAWLSGLLVSELWSAK
jgi:SAM-dependent methyltransferase